MKKNDEVYSVEVSKTEQNDYSVDTHKKEESILPIPIIHTIQSLGLDDDYNLSYDKKKNIATVSGKRDGYNYTVIAEKSMGETLIQTRYPELERKSDYKDEVKLLYSKGLRQKDIAMRLGISQSLVSKLVREDS